MTRTTPNVRAAYPFFGEAIATRRQGSAGQVTARISRQGFRATIGRLQSQREAGERSMGHTAERLGITTFPLDHLLTRLGLPINR